MLLFFLPKRKWHHHVSLADPDAIARRFICLQTDQTNSLICCFRASCLRLLWQFLWVQPTLLLSCMPSGSPTAPRGFPWAGLGKRAKRVANQQGASRIFLVGGDQTFFRRVQTGVACTRYDLSLSGLAGFGQVGTEAPTYLYLAILRLVFRVYLWHLISTLSLNCSSSTTINGSNSSSNSSSGFNYVPFLLLSTLPSHLATTTRKVPAEHATSVQQQQQQQRGGDFTYVDYNNSSIYRVRNRVFLFSTSRR